MTSEQILEALNAVTVDAEGLRTRLKVLDGVIADTAAVELPDLVRRVAEILVAMGAKHNVVQLGHLDESVFEAVWRSFGSPATCRMISSTISDAIESCSLKVGGLSVSFQCSRELNEGERAEVERRRASAPAVAGVAP